MQTTEQMILDIQAAANALKDEMETLITALTDDVSHLEILCDSMEEESDEQDECSGKLDMLQEASDKVQNALTEVEFMADLDVSEIGL